MTRGSVHHKGWPTSTLLRKPQRLGALPQRYAFTLDLKSRKLILEMSGNVLVSQGFYKPPGAATQVGKLTGDALAG